MTATYHDWTILSDPVRSLGRFRVRARCVCGTERVVELRYLINGRSTNCGCRRTRDLRKRSITHGQSHTPEFRIWQGIKARCRCKGQSTYHRYGGRGIAVCERWNSFELFLADMGPLPSAHHSIERLDVNGDYEPSNCVWLLHNLQGKNTTKTRFLTLGTKKLCLRDWARQLGMREATIAHRIDVLSWSVERALTTPSRRMKRA